MSPYEEADRSFERFVRVAAAGRPTSHHLPIFLILFAIAVIGCLVVLSAMTLTGADLTSLADAAPVVMRHD